MIAFCFAALFVTAHAEFSFQHDPNRADSHSQFQLPEWETKRSKNALDPRLPYVIEPQEYYIRIQPYFPAPGISLPEGRNLTFDGISSVRFSVKSVTEVFTLHTKQLSYSTVSLTDAEGLPLNVANYSIDTELQHIIIRPEIAPQVGSSYILQFVYTGIINPYQDGGLFYTYYDDVQRERHWMVSTHMENGLQARAVFPCVDEPSAKAIFHFSMIFPGTLVALANAMERSAASIGGGWSVVQYPPTPRMSTYLVALAVGPFVSKSVVNPAGTLVRIWGWTGQDEYLSFAAEISSKCLYQMGLFTNFTFPMVKSDQIGLPEFRAGAMENFGLVIYKYQYIAFNPKVHTTFVKQAAAKVMCHELSHQWFGDLVTAEWWSDLFLNEGFAAFLEIFSLKLAIPEQTTFLEGKFLVETEQGGLTSDATPGLSHPIFIDKMLIFDDITYKKAPSMLRMVQFTLGFDAFQEALRSYINDYQYHNAGHEMLFQKFTEAARNHGLTDWCGRPLNASLFLDPWIMQQSFPKISVINNQGDGKTFATQESYNNASTLPENSYGYSWPIPLFSKDFRNATSLLGWISPAFDNCGTSTALKSEAAQWHLSNSESSAFVRTQYDDIGYARILDKLKEGDDGTLSMADRIVILGDHIAFLKDLRAAGQPFSFNKVLELTTYIISGYPHFAPFQLAVPVINEVESLFEDGPDYELFQRFMKALLTENVDRLGWNVTGDWDTDIARSYMLAYAVRYDVSDSVFKALSEFRRFVEDCQNSTTGVDDCERAHPDLRRAIYCAGGKYGSDEDFDVLLRLFDQQVINGLYFYQEYYAMLEGMACTTKEERMFRLIPKLLYAFTLSAFTPSFSYISVNPLGGDMMFNFLLQNASTVLSTNLLEQYLSAMTVTWHSQARLQQLQLLNATLFELLDDGQKSIFANATVKVIEQISFFSDHFPNIARFFYDNFVEIGDAPWQKELFHEVIPSFYSLTVQPYFPGSAYYPFNRNFTFDATVNINFTIGQPSDELNLNAHRLIIDPSDVILTTDEGETIRFPIIKKDFDNGILTLPLQNRVLSTGMNCSISIKYVGFILDSSNEGVYTNYNFFEFNDKKAFIFATDFEGGPGVRSLAPCVDEPFYKAPWQVTIVHPADMITLSNMPDRGVVVNQFGWATSVFVPTPPMSSYLVAAAVGHFASVQTVSESGSLVRLWTWTGMEVYSELALQIGSGTVDFIKSYLSMEFPLSKLDIIALPQFTGLRGAHENWGVVCGAYEELLADSLYATADDYCEIAMSVSRATASQWFGDLVTSEWSSFELINEAISEYLAVVGLSSSLPAQSKFANFERFWTGNLALLADSVVNSSQPIITEFDSAFQIDQLNHKGSALLHMLSNAIGAAVLQEGLQNFITKNAFVTVDDQLLWQSLTEAAVANGIVDWRGTALDVKELMDPWAKQATYPTLKVNNNGGTVGYSQEPFIDSEYLDYSSFGYLWTLPVFSSTPEGTQFHYFVGENGTIPFWRRPLGNSWQVENTASKAFFRVWYDDDTWKPIFNQLMTNRSAFDEITRAQLVSDTVALRERGSLTWSRVLDLGLYLSSEDSIAPFAAFRETVELLLSRFKGTSVFEQLQAYVRGLTDGAYHSMGWTSSGDWISDKFSAMITELACSSGNADCLAKADSELKDFVVDCEYSMSGTGACNKIPSDLRRVQYCYGLSQNSDSFPVLKKLYEWFESNSRYFNRDTDNLLNAFCCSTNATAIQSIIEDTISGTYPSVMLLYISNHDSSDLTLWNFLSNHVSDVLYGVVSFDEYLTAAIQTWNTAAHVKLLSSFLDQYGEILSEKQAQSVTNAIAAVRDNIAWLANNADDVQSWLNDHPDFLTADR